MSILERSISACLYTVILKMYFETFLEEKEKHILTTISYIPFMAWQFINANADIASNIMNLLVSILCLNLVLIFGYQGKNIVKIIFAVSYYIVGMLSEVLVWFLFLIFHGTKEVFVNNIFWGSLAANVLLLVIILLLRQKFGKKIKGAKFSVSLLLIPAGSIFVVYTIFKAYAGVMSNPMYAVVSGIIMLGINLVVFGVYINIWKDLESRRLNTVYQRQLELYIQNKKVDEKRKNEARKERHDLKQNLYYILEKAKTGDIETLVSFAEGLENRVAHRQKTAETGNDTLDTLINYQSSEAVVKGIAFKAELNIPADLPYYEPDLCVLLGNLLDNAREAVERDERQEGYIVLSMDYDRGNLIIKVKNSFDGIVKKGKSGKLLTRKADEWEHGLGLESVRMVAEKYSGKMNVDINQEEFGIKIILYQS